MHAIGPRGFKYERNQTEQSLLTVFHNLYSSLVLRGNRKPPANSLLQHISMNPPEAEVGDLMCAPSAYFSTNWCEKRFPPVSSAASWVA